MSEQIDIPMEQKWAIATAGLTGAVVAMGAALGSVAGPEVGAKVNDGIWLEGGKALGEKAKQMGLQAQDVGSLITITMALGGALVGPELSGEIVEASSTRAVIRASGCAWAARQREQGVDTDCAAGHQAWLNGLSAAYGLDVEHSFTKVLTRGDSCCEIVSQLRA